jgi:hypothetical protein
VQTISADGSITNDLDTDTYVLWPKGSAVTRMITLRYGRLPRGFATLKVVGDFTEYGAEEAGVPSDIQLIATRVVGSMLENPGSAYGLKSESVEGHQVVFGEGAGDPFKDDPIVAKLIAERSDILVDDTPRLDVDNYDDEYLGY